MQKKGLDDKYLLLVLRKMKAVCVKKRGITSRTVDQWIAENDKAINTTKWLQFDRLDRGYVSSLKCNMCICFQDWLHSVRNYNPAFITGSKNLRTSSFKEHARSDMHLRAMMLF